MAAVSTSPVLKTTILLPPTGVSAQTLQRIVADLRGSYGGYLLVRIGRGGTTAITAGVGVRVNRMPSFTQVGATPIPYGNAPGDYKLGHPAPVFSVQGGNATAHATTVNGTSTAGTNSLLIASTVGFAAGDLITIDGETLYNRWEVNRVLSVGSGLLVLETPLIFTHTLAQADPVVNKAEMYTIPVDGLSWLELIIDNWPAGVSADPFDYEVFLQEYTNDTSV